MDHVLFYNKKVNKIVKTNPGSLSFSKRVHKFLSCGTWRARKSKIQIETLRLSFSPPLFPHSFQMSSLPSLTFNLTLEQFM
jgi:hypothetical protein